MPSLSTVILASAATVVVARPQDNPLQSAYGFGSYSMAATTSSAAWSESSAAAYSTAPLYSNSWPVSSASAWASSASTANTTTITSYSNTVYVTQATTATATVDCGEGTMIFNATHPTPPPYKPTASPSWSGSAPWSPPMSFSASAPIATTNCANASVTYTYTLKPSGSSSRPAPYYSTAVSPKPYVPTTKAPMPFPAASTASAGPSGATDGSPEEPTSSNGFSQPLSGAAPSNAVASTGSLIAIFSLFAAAFMV